MTSQSPDFTTFRFSTADLPKRDRLAIFREELGRGAMRLDPAPLADDPYHCETTVRSLSGLAIGHSAFAGLRIARPRELLDGVDDLTLVIATSGDLLVSQMGREITLGAGDALLTSSAEVGHITYPSPSRIITLRVPRKALAALVRNPEDLLMRPLPRASEALRLLTHYAGEIDSAYRLAVTGLQHLFVTHVVDLVALVIGAVRDATAVADDRGLAAARLDAVKADIRQRIGEANLSLTALARRQQITPRHIQRLFAGEESTFSQFVLGQRLARSHRLLIDPRRSDRSISAIAYEAGFGDLSYFNRTFRRHFGASPSEIRAATRREG
ncbi:helix-turn-helix domain-containing protein [Bradyrhizobium genosp. P]|uniref:helix-turn-helix domain-containing protein n=1 Tax=Bradyrhizobium genosp. P TaxID=83641 RepID=UPI003CE7B4D3